MTNLFGCPQDPPVGACYVSCDVVMRLALLPAALNANPLAQPLGTCPAEAGERNDTRRHMAPLCARPVDAGNAEATTAAKQRPRAQ